MSDDLEELKRQTQKTSRVAADDPEPEPDPDEPTFADLVLEQIEAVEDGDAHATLSFTDATLSPLIYAIEDDEELREQVIDDLLEGLDIERPDSVDRSTILRLAVRYALTQTAADLVYDAREARAEYAKQQF